MLFGPKAAPSAWGGFGALVSRTTQAIVGTDNGRTQLYVDDPALAGIGNRRRRSLTIQIALLYWTALGIPLASPKRKHSKQEKDVELTHIHMYSSNLG